MVPKTVLPARVNQHVMIIRPCDDLILNYYLLCNLSHSASKNRLLGISQSGSTREAITKSEVEEFVLILPKKDLLEKFEGKCSSLINSLEDLVKSNELLEKISNLLLSKLSTVES
jgi:type I restriction enzyme S subunit